jgi:hypothetical protein
VRELKVPLGGFRGKEQGRKAKSPLGDLGVKNKEEKLIPLWGI